MRRIPGHEARFLMADGNEGSYDEYCTKCFQYPRVLCFMLGKLLSLTTLILNRV